MKVDILYASERRSLCSWDKNVPFLVKAFKRLLAVLHKLFMCFLKVSLWSMAIPRRFTYLVPIICLFSAINGMLLLLIDDTRNII